eukprot:3211261-Rhodomonas_salina.2
MFQYWPRRGVSALSRQYRDGCFRTDMLVLRRLVWYSTECTATVCVKAIDSAPKLYWDCALMQLIPHLASASASFCCCFSALPHHTLSQYSFQYCSLSTARSVPLFQYCFLSTTLSVLFSQYCRSVLLRTARSLPLSHSAPYKIPFGLITCTVS